MPLQLAEIKQVYFLIFYLISIKVNKVLIQASLNGFSDNNPVKHSAPAIYLFLLMYLPQLHRFSWSCSREADARLNMKASDWGETAGEREWRINPIRAIGSTGDKITSENCIFFWSWTWENTRQTWGVRTSEYNQL